MPIDRIRVASALEANNLQALVATSPENVIWSTAYTNWTLFTFNDLEVYAVISPSGDSALVVPIDALDYIAQRPPDSSRLYTYGTFFTSTSPNAVLQGYEARTLELRDSAIHCDSALSALVRALKDLGITRGALGVDERGLPPARWRHLVDQLTGRTLVEANELFRELRIIKTEHEIEQMGRSAQATEAGMLAAFKEAIPGLTEAELEARYRSVVASLGAMPGHFETSAGTRSAGCFPAAHDYVIQSGDIIRSDSGARYFGYWADTGRTAAVGNAPAQLLRYYEALREGIEAILKIVKPGVPVSDLFQTGVETVRTTIPHYQRHHVGHGIGLEMYEAPLLVGAQGKTDIHAMGRSNAVLEEGMVINVELPYYEFGLGGLQIEDTLVVRSDGPQLLTYASRDVFQSAVGAT